MGRNRCDDPLRLPIAFSLTSGLPPGVGQKHCDGSSVRFADAGAKTLWAACTPAQQESLSAQFADGCVEALRDAILDLEDGSINPRAAPARDQRIALGDLLWSSWICFRNRALHEMLGRAEFLGS
jgi:hypothetical protein